jgi:hypothetical protein
VEQTGTNLQDHPNDKPDIVIRDNEKGKCLLIDVITGDRNVIQKEVEKILKYNVCIWCRRVFL